MQIAEALANARTALAADPANQLAEAVAQATAGKRVGLAFIVVLGAPQDDAVAPAVTPAPTAGKRNTGPPADEVRAAAKAAGFNLTGYNLRSKADKLDALAKIEAFVADAASTGDGGDDGTSPEVNPVADPE